MTPTPSRSVAVRVVGDGGMRNQACEMTSMAIGPVDWSAVACPVRRRQVVA
jgi:hypothetical protein